MKNGAQQYVCNGGVAYKFKVLSSFNRWFRGTGCGFGSATAQTQRLAASFQDKIQQGSKK
jgi:hypothetical protein